MAEALWFEKVDKLGNPIKRLKTPKPATACPLGGLCQAKKPHIDMTVDVPADILVVSSSEDDPNYDGTTECTSPEDSDVLDTDTDWPSKYNTIEDAIESMMHPSNAEVLHLFIITLTD
jgi:hypothetical protein